MNIKKGFVLMGIPPRFLLKTTLLFYEANLMTMLTVNIFIYLHFCL